MSENLNFELLLLDRMSRDYKLSILHEIGLTEAEAKQLREKCSLKYPGLAESDAATFRNILGSEIPRGHITCGNVELPAGCSAHYFLLMLWPHLFWVVQQCKDATSCEIGFENQTDLSFLQFDPRLVRVGLWTRGALEKIADRHELCDGWDEEVVIQFAFGSRLFKGTFVFGLLQEWLAL